VFHRRSCRDLKPGEDGAALRLPWDAKAPPYAVGVWARELGAVVPGRLPKLHQKPGAQG